uniref:WAP domain-containing protein n=1 Tax=Anolis carolinensis TaxID=28377 RepID=A0A803SLF6_ANOCA
MKKSVTPLPHFFLEVIFSQTFERLFPAQSLGQNMTVDGFLPKPGRCPPFSKIGCVEPQQDRCKVDAKCPWPKKCCYQPCSLPMLHHSILLLILHHCVTTNKKGNVRKQVKYIFIYFDCLKCISHTCVNFNYFFYLFFHSNFAPV